MIQQISIALLSTLGLTYAGISAFAVLRADSMIFPAPPSSYADSATLLKLTASDGERIVADYLPVAGAKRLLLYSHGNGEDIGHLRPLLEAFQRAGIAVLAYDYPGYGRSSGQPSEAGCYAAIQAAFDYATQTLGFAPEAIVLYGRSLGSGPSAWLAEQTPVAALIFDGAFTSTFRVLTGRKLLPWDKFDNYARLPDISCPILLIHGTEDRTVPFSHAERNWAVIQSPKYRLFVQGAHHGNVIDVAGRDYWETVLPFIEGDLQ